MPDQRSSPGGRRRPNLLVIMVDQLRASALGMYGNPELRTPYLDALAASGVRYDWAFTPNPICVPARVSFWTGRWGHLTGSRTNGIYMPDTETHLLHLLADAGYTCGLLGKNHCFTPSQIERFFDTYYPAGHLGPHDPGADPQVAAAKEFCRQMGGPGGPAYAAQVSPFAVEKHGTWLVGAQADRFIRTNRDRPWCAWVSIADPHTPYQVSEPYASLYPPETLRLPPHEPPGYPGKPERVRLFAELMGADVVSDDHLRFVLSIYYGMVTVIDETVARLMATLDELGLRQETIVVFTADHGDYMTEHRLVRKGASMYDPLVHVPLLVSFPARVASGQASDALVSVLDVFPTLTTLLDLPLPAGRSGRPLPGATAEGDETAPREAIFSEYGAEGSPPTRAGVQARLEELRAAGRGGGNGALPWGMANRGKMKMIRTREWKYTYQPGGDDELSHLADDPHELVNLARAPEHRERVEDFRRQLLDWTVETEDTLPGRERVTDLGH